MKFLWIELELYFLNQQKEMSFVEVKKKFSKSLIELIILLKLFNNFIFIILKKNQMYQDHIAFYDDCNKRSA
jgi:hypothetical protein